MRMLYWHSLFVCSGLYYLSISLEDSNKIRVRTRVTDSDWSENLSCKMKSKRLTQPSGLSKPAGRRRAAARTFHRACQRHPRVRPRMCQRSRVPGPGTGCPLPERPSLLLTQVSANAVSPPQLLTSFLWSLCLGCAPPALPSTESSWNDPFFQKYILIYIKFINRFILKFKYIL